MTFQEAKCLFEIYNNEKIDIYHENYGKVQLVDYSISYIDTICVAFEKEEDVMYLNSPTTPVHFFIPQAYFNLSSSKFSLSINIVDGVFLKCPAMKM